jgi:hypothetical protein
MAQQGLLFQFPWLQYTSLAQVFTDHHLLYHLFIIPWLQWFNPIVSVKIVQVIGSVGLCVLLLYILRRWQLPYRIPAVLFIYTITPFLIRLNLVKATPFALIITYSITLALLHKKYWWSLALSIVYTYVHGGFVIAVVVATIIWCAETITLSLRNRRLLLGDPRGIFSTLFGIMLGLVLNPYFPHNLNFYWQQLVQIGLINYQDVIAVGAEWYPYAPANLTGAISLLLITVICAAIIMIQQRQRYARDTTAVALLLLGVFFLIATLRSRRYIEYCVPFLWLWACYMILPYIQSRAWRPGLLSLKQQFGRWYHIFILYFVVTVSFTVGRGVVLAYQNVTVDVFPVTKYQTASAYITEHTQPGTIVFNADWDDFPMLFYHNPAAYYIVGLDATFMYLYNPELYLLWRDLTTGKIKSNLAATITQHFKADYVVIDRHDNATQLFNAYLQRDPNIRLEFEDSDSRVYHILL